MPAEPGQEGHQSGIPVADPGGLVGDPPQAGDAVEARQDVRGARTIAAEEPVTLQSDPQAGRVDRVDGRAGHHFLPWISSSRWRSSPAQPASTSLAAARLVTVLLQRMKAVSPATLRSSTRARISPLTES